MLPKTAIIGATGILGRNFFLEYKKIHPDCIGTSRDRAREGLSYFDLSSPSVAPLKLAENGHQEALISAGISKMAICEQEKELTRKINVEGISALIRQLVNERIKPIFFSSDIVFDGLTGGYDDEALTQPLNEYAMQKAQIESFMKKIFKQNSNCLVVRLSKVFSLCKGDGTLLDEMASILKSGGHIRAAQDQVFCPTFVSDLVEVVKILQMKNATGIINVCSPEAWSRYDIALSLAHYMKINPNRIEKISLNDLNEPYARPKNTSMQIKKLERITDFKFTPMKQCIQKAADIWRE